MRRSFRFGPRQSDVEKDVRNEIEAHIEQRASEFEAQGMGAEAARAAALEAFGNPQEVESEVRSLRHELVTEQRRRLWWDELRQDLTTAVRHLRRSPLFTSVALLTLALGIGANTSAFSVLRSVILRPLPYPESERLVQVWMDHSARGRAEPEWLTPPQFLAMRNEVPAFETVSAYQGWAPSLTGEGDPEPLTGGAVSAEFLNVLRTPPAIGRNFTLADDDASAEPVVILTDGLWRRRFSADPAILGRSIQLSGVSWTVIGVMPPTFRPPLAWELLRPMRRPADSGCNHGCVTLRAIARLSPGATMETADQQIAAMLERQVAEAPEENTRIAPLLVPLHEQVTGPVRPSLIALFGAVAFVLLIACVNLASLTMVRSTMRAREFGVRAALGAGRGRIVRQLLTESLLLAVVGGALGIWLGVFGTRLLSILVPESIRGLQAIELDGTAVAFSVALTVVIGIVFGLIPALQGAKPNLMNSLRTSHAEGSGGQRVGRVRRRLVVAEVAIALVLLVGAGLLLRTLLNLQRTEMGFSGQGLVTASLSYPPARYPEAQSVSAAAAALLEKLRAHPALNGAELVSTPPLLPGGDSDIGALADGAPPAPGSEAKSLWYRSVSNGALRMLGTRLLAGRPFGSEDRAGGPRGVIITESAAKRLWPDQDPIGRYFTTNPSPNAVRYTIVGVVADIRHDGPREPAKDQVFLPYVHAPPRVFTLLLRPSGNEEAAIAALREAVRQADPEMPVGAITTFKERFNDVTALPRHFAVIVGSFAAAAVLLALIGVYGMMAYAVTQRRAELGVRMALGADPSRLSRWLVGEGAVVIGVGVVLGLAGSVAGTRLLQASLYGVSPFDGVTLATTVVAIVLAGLLACWLPARRVREVNPVNVLRAE